MKIVSVLIDFFISKGILDFTSFGKAWHNFKIIISGVFFASVVDENANEVVSTNTTADIKR